MKSGDSIVTTSFGPVDGMPWVSAVDAEELGSRVRGMDASLQVSWTRDVSSALRSAVDIAAEGPLVVAGSLYLVSDVLRLLRQQ